VADAMTDHPMTNPDVAEVAGKRVGPALSIRASCVGCAFERSVSYRVQGDSGSDVYCDHPDANGKRVADTRWDTPEWCPAGAAMHRVRQYLNTPSGES
jgi:hypothetical protein